MREMSRQLLHLSLALCPALSIALERGGSQAVAPYTCTDGVLRGDANFTQPTKENAVQYKKMSETFQKVPFNATEFLRCGEVSGAFPLAERTEDATQDGLAAHSVNAQCLHCLSQGCGYCFVANRLQGDDQAVDLYPGEAPIADIRISTRSQCLYDPVPGGLLCEQRLETHTCQHRPPVFIDSVRGCYAQAEDLVRHLSAVCAAEMPGHLLQPPPLLRNVSALVSDVAILGVDAIGGVFEAQVALELSWTDARLMDPVLNPCGARWPQLHMIHACYALYKNR